MAENAVAIGVDLGGTHLRWAVVNHAGDRLHQGKALRPREAEEVIRAIAGGIRECLAYHPGAIGVGLAVPGIITRSLVTSNSLDWHGFPLLNSLSEIPLPIQLTNDMAAGAVGELHYGRARGAENVIFITVSTGIGAGIILRRQVYRGANGLAGEVGHTVVDLNGLLCGCGRRGCWEMIASGTAHRRRIREAYQSGTWPNLDHEPDPAEVTRRAASGDRAARALVLRTARYVGIGVSNLVNLYDPEAIVFTGGFARHNWEIIREYLLQEVRDQSFDQFVRLELTALGDDAGVMGAAALVLNPGTLPDDPATHR